MELIFATQNPNKVKEIQSLCPPTILIKSLADLSFTAELPETQKTIEGNSLQKAQYVFEQLNQACFSEDTGLIVDAINGAPGVKTARYAGDNATAKDNINKLLKELQNSHDRKARFVTVITLINTNGQAQQFTGVCEGKILKDETGGKGFGYDPIFQPTGSNKSFAEMDMTEKNMYSHRAKAFAKFVEHLKNK